MSGAIGNRGVLCGGYQRSTIAAIEVRHQSGFLSYGSGRLGACTLAVGETLWLLEQPPDFIAVGRVVRRQRLIQDLSQEALANRAGVNRKHLSGIEQGNHDPQASTLIKLARGLGMSLGELGAAIDEELARVELERRR